MPKAFCPGHITCFFSPGDAEGELASCGSTGLGIRLSAGATVSVEETSSRRISVVIDGEESPAPVTAEVLRAIMPGRGAEVAVENGLPVGQGFGMSAAGAVAAALCAAEIAGVSEDEAWRAAHEAEITGGGGRGDVDAIQCAAHVPLRVRQGLPPFGEVVGTGLRFPVLTVAVLGPKMNTGRVLSDPVSLGRIRDSGAEAARRFDGSGASLFAESNRFSASASLESADVAGALRRLRDGNRRAAMCMLGNSIFSDAPFKMVLDALPDAEVFPVMSTSERARITRRRSRGGRVDQDSRRLLLIRLLLEERGLPVDVPGDSSSQRDMLRALLVTRPAVPADPRLLKIQDEYLRIESESRGIVELDDLAHFGRIALWHGDATRLAADAVVDAANGRLTGCWDPRHPCVDRSIHTFAGMQLRLECAGMMKAQGHAEPVGSARVTPAYNLPCRYVIHTVGPRIDGAVGDEQREALRSCYRSCLEAAEEMGLDSAVFPCISAGTFGFPPEDAAEIAMDAVERHLEARGLPRTVVFATFLDRDRDIYLRLLSERGFTRTG